MSKRKTDKSPSLRLAGFDQEYSSHSLKDVTKTISRPLDMLDNETYQLVTVKRRNEGIVERGWFKGRDIKVKNQFIVKAGDFLISKRQIIHGACEIVPLHLDGAIVSNEYHILHGKEDILLTEYLNLLAKLPKLKKYFALACVGVDIEKMLFKIEDWHKRKVNLPSTREQRKVIEFFALLSKKMDKQQEKIEELELFKRGMMQRIFSQEIRFKDENGKVFPDWIETSLGIIATFFSGGTPQSTNSKYYNGDIPFIRSAEINSNTTELFISKEGLENSSSKMVNKGDLLMALYGANSGEIGISKIDGAINQAILCIRTEENVEYIKYYWQYMKENIVGTYLQGGQGNLSAALVKGVTILLPSIREQHRIGNYFSIIDLKIEKEREKLDALMGFKKSLMQQMFI